MKLNYQNSDLGISSRQWTHDQNPCKFVQVTHAEVDYQCMIQITPRVGWRFSVVLMSRMFPMVLFDEERRPIYDFRLSMMESIYLSTSYWPHQIWLRKWSDTMKSTVHVCSVSNRAVLAATIISCICALGRPNLQPWSAYATDPVGGRNPRVGRPTLTDGTAPASRAGTRSAAETCRSGREFWNAAPAARAVGG